MAVRAVEPEPIEAQEAVELTLALIDREHLSPVMAVMRVLDAYDLTDEATATFVRGGLGLAVSGARTGNRNAAAREINDQYAEQSRWAVRNPGGRAAKESLLARLPYEGAGEGGGNLLAFSFLDVEKWTHYMASRAASFTDKAKFGEDLIAAMSKHKAQVVGKLPKSVLAEFERRAAEIWG